MKSNKAQASKSVRCGGLTKRSCVLLTNLLMMSPGNSHNPAFGLLITVGLLFNPISGLPIWLNGSYNDALGRRDQAYGAVSETTADRYNQQRDCNVKVEKTQRFDFQLKKPAWVEYKGDNLDVTPWERIVFKVDVQVNIPKAHTVSFSAGNWKSFVFSPKSLEGEAVGSKSVDAIFTVPDEEPGTKKSIVGNTFTVELKWTCTRNLDPVASGTLWTLKFSGKKGPGPGGIKGTVTGPNNQAANTCEMQLYREGVLVGSMLTSFDKGEYFFEKLLPAEYTVKATGLCSGSGQPKQEFKPEEKKTKVESDKVAEVDFKLKESKSK